MKEKANGTAYFPMHGIPFIFLLKIKCHKSAKFHHFSHDKQFLIILKTK